jgi:hypothetical protein
MYFQGLPHIMLSHFLRKVLSILAFDYVVLQMQPIFDKDTVVYNTYKSCFYEFDLLVHYLVKK